MRLVSVLLTVGVAFALANAEPQKPAEPKPPDASAWQDLLKPITDSTGSRPVAGREENEVRLCMVAVDRTNGWLYVQPGQKGLWRSKNQGRTFEQIGVEVINEGGVRHSHSWAAVQVHPAGGKIAIFSMCSGWVDPVGMCGYSLDHGASWKELIKFGRQFTMGTMNWDGDCQVLFCTGWPDHGGMLYSSDGGAHWFQRNWSGARDYQGVGIFSANVLVASSRGPNSVTLRSEDAGKTWTKVGNYETSGTVWFFKGKPYWMSRTGVLTSSDAGKTWTVVGSKLPVEGFAGPYFGKDEKHMVVATLRNGFHETTDSGTTWHPLAPYPAVFPAEMTLNWHSFGYDPVHDVLYAHTDRRDGKLLPTTTAKLELKRWSEAKIEAAATPAAKPAAAGAPCLSGVWFTDASTGYAVGFRGTILKTTNGGTSWVEQPTGGARDHLYAVHFPNASTGQAVGYLGSGFETKDAGAKWASKRFDRKVATLRSIHFVDAQTGYAAGDCWVYKTTDGGAKWAEMTPFNRIEPRMPADHILHSVYFPRSEIGYVAGEMGMIFKTSDGGTKWTRQTSGTDSDLYSICFLDAENGYAVGDRGTILKTTTGGAKWVSQTSGTTSWLFSVCFLDRTTGYAVGEAGTILKTTDGGATWVKQTSGTEKHLYSVHFPDAKTGYAVGELGTILKTKDGGAQWTLLKR